ncbi:MAG: prolyl oligopeptidase family serine peptidase, partial [Clostridia bacterium]|nr:prolyl oligopeptidase family serine peptidase [Clostridia bacterium]
QWVNTPWNKGNYSVANVPESAQLKAVMELLDTVEATYSVDKSRVYAMGVSMGGFGTWDLLMRHPDRFAAGMPLCGAADPAMAQAVKDIPIYTFHGSADTTVPVSGTRAMVDAVQAAGGKVLRYEELEGEGHLIQIPIFKRPEVSEWLFAQKKQ